MIIEEIYDLIVNKGWSIRNIADYYRIDERDINLFINDLKKQDIDKYNAIIFSRDVFKMPIVDKDFLDEVISLGLKKYTNLEIGLLLNKKQVEINQVIKVLANSNCVYYNPSLYQNIIARQHETLNLDKLILYKRLDKIINYLNISYLEILKISPSTFAKGYINYRNTLLMLRDFLESDSINSLDDLSNTYHLTKDSVSKVFNQNDDLNILKKEFSQDVKIIKEKYQKIITSNSKKYKNIDVLKPSNDAIYYKIRERQNFWLMVIITFELSLKDFTKLIGEEDEKRVKEAINYLLRPRCYDKYYHAINFLWNKPKSESHFLQAKLYVMELSLSKKNKDSKKYEELLAKIRDLEYINVIKKHREKSSKYTEEEIRIIVNYVIKYAAVRDDIPVSERVYKGKCPVDLKEKLQEVSEYNLGLIKVRK